MGRLVKEAFYNPCHLCDYPSRNIEKVSMKCWAGDKICPDILKMQAYRLKQKGIFCFPYIKVAIT